MKLLSLTATFGCLNNETLTFSEGFTLIGAPNGAGKSTWCAFLRTMLYGLDTRQRDKKGDPADKNRYRPWSGAPMEGLLVCEHEGKVIELRRTSGGGIPMGEFSAIEQESGLPVEGLTAANVGEALTGVSREVFDRSVFLRQTGLAVSQSQELEKRVAALVSTGEEDVSWSEAEDRLKAWQRRRRSNRTGLIPQLEQEEAALRQSLARTAALQQELDDARARADELYQRKTLWDDRLATENHQRQNADQQRRAEAATDLDAAEVQVRSLRAQIQDLDAITTQDPQDTQEQMRDIRRDLKSRKTAMTVFVVLVVLLTLVAAALYIIPLYGIELPLPFVIPLLPPAFLLIPAAALWVLVLLLGIIKAVSDRRDRQDLEELAIALDQADERTIAYESCHRALNDAILRRDQAKRHLDAMNQTVSGGAYLPPEAEVLRDDLHAAEREVAQLQGQLSALGDPVAVDARLDEVEEQLTALQADYDAIDVAMEALREADRQLHARFSPKLTALAGTYLSRLTGGKYSQIGLDRSLDVTLTEGDSLAPQPLALFSQGTADQLYLALRLAVSQLVLPDASSCPLILDDALTSFDDERLKLALDCLLELSKEKQVILFSCQHREIDLLADAEGVTVQTLKGL